MKKNNFQMWKTDGGGIKRMHVSARARGIFVGMCAGCRWNDDGYQTDGCSDCRMGSGYHVEEKALEL